MDIASLLSTSIPAYFTVGPALVLLVVLVTLIAKSVPKNQQLIQSQAPAQPIPTPPQPVATPTSVQATPPEKEVLPPSETIVVASTPSSSAHETVVVQAEPAVEVTPSAPEKPEVPPTIPPVSAWKPRETPMPIVEDVPAQPLSGEVQPSTEVVQGSAEVSTQEKPTF